MNFKQDFPYIYYYSLVKHIREDHKLWNHIYKRGYLPLCNEESFIKNVF